VVLEVGRGRLSEHLLVQLTQKIQLRTGQREQ